MIFSSFSFILAFLPIAAIGFYCLSYYQRTGLTYTWLIAVSLYFYAQWKPEYLLLLATSIGVNYAISHRITVSSDGIKKRWLFAGILFNLCLLAYYKYANFIVDNINYLANSTIDLQTIILPLAISFFTFQQIAYLVDCYQPVKQPERGFLRYCLFVCFFPQLIAGPIVHHSEMMPQFEHPKINVENIAKGLAIFSIGLFKKVIIADTLAIWVNNSFSHSESINIIGAWLASFCYTLQLYFDFSGYADMAIGAALLFNIKLPLNFNSPYRSLSIQSFWQSWHITLSRWLKNYLYFPLGGNQKGHIITLRNLLIIALISGVWHGAGWTFILWGLMHAIALVTHRIWQITTQHSHHNLPAPIAWLMTFLFVNFAWVMFRADNITQALQIYQAMYDFKELTAILHTEWTHLLNDYQSLQWALVFSDVTNNKLLQWGTLAIAFIVCLIMPNSQNLIGIHTTAKINITRWSSILILTMMTLSALASLALGNYSEFIYFNF